MRLDVLLVNLGLAESRTQAQDLIRGGYVLLRTTVDRPLLKASAVLTDDQVPNLYVSENPLQRYVSRGGLKLEAALRYLKLSVEGFNVLDVGQSTGGFTDCLLQSNVKTVVGVDVGKDQLHPKLKVDPRVQAFQGLHANEMHKSDDFLNAVPASGFDLVVADISFISLTKVMRSIKPYLKAGGRYLLLVKPQFELSPSSLDRNGIVKDAEENYKKVEANIRKAAFEMLGEVSDYFQSALPGKDGNTEFFISGIVL